MFKIKENGSNVRTEIIGGVTTFFAMAYIIFTNASLEDMARKAPRTQEEFLKVNGVGSSKAQRYGQAFLECIREYTASHRED